MLAEDDAVTGIGWVTVVTGLGLGGMAWYMLVRTWPGTLKEFRGELALERQARDAQVSAFSASIKAEHEAFDRSLDRIVASFERQQAMHRETVREVMHRLGEANEPEKGKG